MKYSDNNPRAMVSLASTEDGNTSQVAQSVFGGGGTGRSVQMTQHGSVWSNCRLSSLSKPGVVPENDYICLAGNGML